MKIITRTILITTLALALPAIVSAQRVEREKQRIPELSSWNIKTNLLADLTTTLSLGAEFRTGGHTSIDIPFYWNPWEFGNNTKWKHFLVQPEFRYWIKETFRGSFFGLHAHYANYNVGHLPHGPFSQYMRDHRFEGWLAGAGVSYGYRWNFSYHWGLEATIGVGYAHLGYKEALCEVCATMGPKESKDYFGITKLGVNLIYSIGRKPQPRAAYVPAPVEVVIYEPLFEVSYLTPEAEEIKHRNLVGKAYLDYHVDRAEIVSDYKENAKELKLIHETIESVQGDADVTIHDVTITGYASPEATYAHNQGLSERRATSLKNLVSSIHGISADKITAHGHGEDWATLEKLVSESNISHKSELLEVIRSGGDADAREQRLKAVGGGAPYRQLLAEYYPQLRRSDYDIHYTVTPFTVEVGREIILTRPGSLSMQEMFLVARSYEPGSDAAHGIYETAVRTYPDHDIAHLNAAASALGRRDLAAGARHLGNVKDQTPAYWNNMGVLSWLQGDKAKAAEAFAKAGTHGNLNAAELRKHLNSLGL